jgi:hypothetical protein
MINLTREEAQQVLDALTCSEEEMNCEYGVTEILRSRLNTPEREWVGLTDEEYTELWGKKPFLLNFFRKIEAKLKEKNT